jgi:hypothetical protein
VLGLLGLGVLAAHGLLLQGSALAPRPGLAPEPAARSTAWVRLLPPHPAQQAGGPATALTPAAAAAQPRIRKPSTPGPAPRALAATAVGTAQRPPPGPAAHSHPAAGPAAGPALPVYPTRLPPATTRHYRVQRGAEQAWAQLAWQPEGAQYQLSLQMQAEAGLPGPGSLHGLGAVSRGQLVPEGLQPERYLDRRQGRDHRAANFDAQQRLVRGSGGGPAWPFPPGGQDRLSWLLQLAAVLQADAALATPGARVVLAVAGPREPTQPWVFEVQGMQAYTLADGSQRQALVLRRQPGQPYDLLAEVWLDPAEHHLPLGWQLSAPPGPWSSHWRWWPPSAPSGTSSPLPP